MFLNLITTLLLMGNIDAWFLTKITITLSIPVLKFPQKMPMLNHQKNQFGIIIAQHSEFFISIEADEKIKNFNFYCLDYSPTGGKIIDFKGETNIQRNLTAINECVPVASVSYQIPINVTITATKWNYLPIFYSYGENKNKTIEDEGKFYDTIESYGFIENFYTQMLLTSRDVILLKASNSSLIKTLQKHTDVVRYYIKLLGENDYNQQSIFLRSNMYQNFECNSNFTNDWINANTIMEFFNDNYGHLNWCTLTKIGQFYEIKYFIKDLNIVGNVWRHLFANLYRKSIKHKELMVLPVVYSMTLKQHYFNAIPIQQWTSPLKVHFFKILFNYNNFESIFREFNRQHLKYSNLNEFNDIVYNLIEVFLVHQNLNILSHLRRINLMLMENTSPRWTEDKIIVREEIPLDDDFLRWG
ncbi:uncharacterized protein LOC127290930 [Leptopilina boulardi]|uniref:uncharacterized protein LOC127290930 n=1 Tax=Leptopilina boulardi TaxID=63433 RepID=UPI0021F6253F|nr:uncharacterized protein LOC127290930 [Leptopilina boulardi]